MAVDSEELTEMLQTAMDRAYYFFKNRDLANAKCLYEQILKVDPDQTDAIHMLGLVEYEMGYKDRSLKLLLEAEEKGCCSWQFHNSMGTVKSHFDHSAEAVKYFKDSIAINPRAAGVYVNLGIEYSKQLKFKKAEQSFLKAAKVDVNNYHIWFNLGNIYSQQLKMEKSIKSFRRAIEINSGFLPARWNLAHALLMTGHFPEGWKEYECRWKLFEPYAYVRRRFSKYRLWNGESLSGKSIALYSEQGSGDALQFIRYARILKEMGASQVVIEWPVGQTRGDLSSVLMGVDGVDQVAHGTLPQVDYHQSLLSLPLILGYNMYWDQPYVKIASKKRKNKRFKVGVAWKGNPVHFNDSNRSSSFEQFTDIANIPGVEVYSLHKERTTLPIRQTNLKDFQDTANLIANLDCVIAVDTAVAHLAAAMGKETYILIPYVPDWRWMLQRTTSPWYGTVRLIRQTKIGCWEQPLQQVREVILQHQS